MSDPPWLDDRQQQAWRSFMGAHRAVLGLLARDLAKESGLSMPDYEVLASLSEAPGGRMRAFQLGLATDWEKSRLSHQLTRMSQRGLVRREPCANDSRYFDVVITEQGRAAIVEAAPRHATQVRALFADVLTAEELDTLTATLQKVLDGVHGPCEEAAAACAGAQDDAC